MVKVYSIPTCPWCIKLKQFLKDNDIIFDDVDVSSDQSAAEKMIEISGQMSVPVIDIDGEIIVGFDQGKITQILGL